MKNAYFKYTDVQPLTGHPNSSPMKFSYHRYENFIGANIGETKAVTKYRIFQTVSGKLSRMVFFTSYKRYLSTPDERHLSTPDERHLLTPDERHLSTPDKRVFLTPDKSNLLANQQLNN
jgi:hypothetical protein